MTSSGLRSHSSGQPANSMLWSILCGRTHRSRPRSGRQPRQSIQVLAQQAFLDIRIEDVYFQLLSRADIYVAIASQNSRSCNVGHDIFDLLTADGSQLLPRASDETTPLLRTRQPRLRRREYAGQANEHHIAQDVGMNIRRSTPLLLSLEAHDRIRDLCFYRALCRSTHRRPSKCKRGPHRLPEPERTYLDGCRPT